MELSINIKLIWFPDWEPIGIPDPIKDCLKCQNRLQHLGVGVDAIPDFVKNSPVFDGNDLGMLGNIEALPTN